MSDYESLDRTHMARALVLAAQGLYGTSPNPRVGCVIARGDVVLGEGYHVRAGAAHAEVAALAAAREAGHDVRGATLHVTLEPCNHHGRTPPCVDAILAAGIGRVVAAMADPNPEAAHGGDRLRSAGVAVDVGMLEDEAREINIGFVARMTRGTPWVRLKAATSVDGRTALSNGASRWITSDEARTDGHRWRARACAVLTGVGTVLSDDPQLTVRAVETPRQPLRVVIDRHADTPPGARIFEGAGALMVTAGARNPAWPATAEVLALPDADERVDLHALMRELGRRQVNELHVEAGAKLNGALLAHGLVDEILHYMAPNVLGDPARGMFERALPLAALEERSALAWHSVERIGPDLRLLTRVVKS